jgi:hypothetical protein
MLNIVYARLIYHSYYTNRCHYNTVFLCILYMSTSHVNSYWNRSVEHNPMHNHEQLRKTVYHIRCCASQNRPAKKTIIISTFFFDKRREFWQYFPYIFWRMFEVTEPDSCLSFSQLVEQELLTLPEHSFTLCFSGFVWYNL